MAADLGDRRRFFISHSSQQKPFALELNRELEGDAWVDLHEIDIGDVLLEEISKGISSASDFVLLWSSEAAESAWVGYEIHMAFIRYLEDNAINLRVVTLDDTPVPLYLRPLLQARDVLTPERAAALLLGDPPASRTLRTFVNRSDEIAALESTLYSDQKGFMWFFGLAGIGKRSLAREGLRRLLADRDRALRITVRAGTGFVELHLALCEALGIETPRNPMVESEARQAAVNLLTDYSSGGGVWLFEEVQHWLDEEAKPKHQLSIVLEALHAVGVKEAERGAVFTSTRRPTLTGATAEASEFRRVRGLSSAFAVALLRGAGAEGDDGLIKRAASQLDGHPLALEMAVPDLAESTSDWEDRQLVC